MLEKFLAVLTSAHSAMVTETTNSAININAAEVADAKPPSSGSTLGSMSENANDKALSEDIETILDFAVLSIL